MDIVPWLFCFSCPRVPLLALYNRSSDRLLHSLCTKGHCTRCWLLMPTVRRRKLCVSRSAGWRARSWQYLWALGRYRWGEGDLRAGEGHKGVDSIDYIAVPANRGGYHKSWSLRAMVFSLCTRTQAQACPHAHTHARTRTCWQHHKALELEAQRHRSRRSTAAHGTAACLCAHRTRYAPRWRWARIERCTSLQWLIWSPLQ